MTACLDILYEDNHLLVVNKPAGLLTQPSGTEQRNVEDLAKSWLKEKYQKPGNVFLSALHRLDKSVSGIILFAKTSKALSRLNQTLREKQSEKRYIAWIEGKFPASEGILENHLIHDNFRAMVMPDGTPNAKLARLHYRVIDGLTNFSCLEILLETGRYHQIRCQLAHNGYPILGDQKYGSHIVFYPNAIALHHLKLSIVHPITQEFMCFEAPLPSFWMHYFKADSHYA